MTPKEMVVYQNKLYYVYKKLRTSQIKEGYLNEVKEFWRCDVVVKNKIQQDENLLFLREIEEATIVS
jgi:hypothetical protein